MDRIFKQRWKTILFFAVLACLFVGIFYGAIHGPWDPRFRRRMEKYQVQPSNAPKSFVRKDKLTLHLNHPLSTQRYRFVYHGIENHRIHLALYILDLDPNFAYHHRVDIAQARSGFRMGEQAFRLESYGKNKIRLVKQQ